MLGIAHLMYSKSGQEDWTNSDNVPVIPIALKEAVYEKLLFLLSAIVGIDRRNAMRGSRYYHRQFEDGFGDFYHDSSNRSNGSY